MKTAAIPPSVDAEQARHVFVYGTLRRGEANDINRLSPAPIFVADASLAGTLYPMGWYPGLVLGGSSQVVGEIYRITPQLEEQLDLIEGLLPEPTGEYSKTDVRVEVSGTALDCFVYEIAPALVGHLEPLAGGDWVQRPGA